MKIKLYEKVSNTMIWFFIIGGLVVVAFAINNSIVDFSLGRLIFGLIFAAALLVPGFTNLMRRKRGDLVETVYKCEKYEVIE